MSEDRLIADQQFVRENTGHQTLQKNRAGSGMIEQPPQSSYVGMAPGLIEIGRGMWNAHDRACLRWKSVKSLPEDQQVLYPASPNGKSSHYQEAQADRCSGRAGSFSPDHKNERTRVRRATLTDANEQRVGCDRCASRGAGCLRVIPGEAGSEDRCI